MKRMALEVGLLVLGVLALTLGILDWYPPTS